MYSNVLGNQMHRQLDEHFFHGAFALQTKIKLHFILWFALTLDDILKQKIAFPVGMRM